MVGSPRACTDICSAFSEGLVLLQPMAESRRKVGASVREERAPPSTVANPFSRETLIMKALSLKHLPVVPTFKYGHPGD